MGGSCEKVIPPLVFSAPGPSAFRHGALSSGWAGPVRRRLTPDDRSGAVTFDDLLRAPVPALCQHDPGNLVHGQLPPQDGHPGNVGIALNYTQPARINRRRDSRLVTPTAGYSAGQLYAHMHADRLP